MGRNEVGQAERLRGEIWRLAGRIARHPRADVCEEEAGGRILQVDDKRSLWVNYPGDEATISLNQNNTCLGFLQRITIIEARGGVDERAEIYMEEYAEVFFIFSGYETTRVRFNPPTRDEQTGMFVRTFTGNFTCGGLNLDRLVLDEDGGEMVFEYNVDSPPREMVDGMRTRLGQMKRWLAEVPRVRQPARGKTA